MQNGQKPEFFDIHSHLNDVAYDDDREAVIERMKKEGVSALVVGTDEKMSEDAVALAEKYDHLWAVVGLHPTDSSENFSEDFYRKLLVNPRVVAIGECGLDYFRAKEDTESERKQQRDTFEKQLELACELDKPLMIHCRDAHEDMLSILQSKKKEHGEKLRGDIHFFTGSVEIASQYFDLDFTVSFTGVLTFTHDYDDVVSFAPLSHIMSETDCPYVSPAPFRGKRNEPSYVSLVAEKIAEIRSEDAEVVKNALVSNAYRVFDLVNS